MPDVDPFLLHTFREIGMADSKGMQLTPLSFIELDAYCNRMKVDLTPWESINIIDMSRDYVGWLNKGTNPQCTSPWKDRSDEAMQANDNAIAEKMKSLRGKKNEPR